MVAVESLYGVLHYWSLSSADWQQVSVFIASNLLFSKKVICHCFGQQLRTSSQNNVDNKEGNDEAKTGRWRAWQCADINIP